MRKLYYILIIMFYFGSVSAQEENNSYLASLLYLKTNQDINNKIKKFFKHELKSYGIKKNDYVLFNLSERIYFQSIVDFKNMIDSAKYKLDDILIDDRIKYEEKYGFEEYKYETFKDLIPINGSPLCLAFSKPVNNYLIAEISVRENCSISQHPNILRGTVVNILFFFKDNGTVEQVYINGFHYN